MGRIRTLDIARLARRALTVGSLSCLPTVLIWSQAEVQALSVDESAAAQNDASYVEKVAHAIALARSGLIEEAEESLSQAVQMMPERAEAHRERGALYFREKRYREAARDLGAAVARSGDVETRRLLGAALYLSGRAMSALRVWNALDEPRLRELRFSGLSHTRPPLVRGEIPLTEGKLLSLRRLEEAELRLRELGTFDRVSVRPIPWGDGTADLDVAFVERHGLAGSRLEFAARTIAQLVSERVELRYANLHGWGLTLGGRYRWRRSQPMISLECDWPRPFGLDVKATVRVSRGRQLFEIDNGDNGIELRDRGVDLNLQHVVDGRTLAQVGFGYRKRTFSGSHGLATPGDYYRVQLGLKRKFHDSRHLTATAAGLMNQSTGRGIRFRRGILTLEGSVRWRERGHADLPPPSVAFQLKWGVSSKGTPLDELLMLGGGSDSEWPLRAHRRAYGGAVGQTPLAQRVFLGNIEFRHWIFSMKIARIGIVFAYSPAFLDGVILPDTRERQFQDIGIGLRLAGSAGIAPRMDVGFGLLDGRKAVFFGWNEWF